MTTLTAAQALAQHSGVCNKRVLVGVRVEVGWGSMETVIHWIPQITCSRSDYYERVIQSGSLDCQRIAVKKAHVFSVWGREVWNMEEMYSTAILPYKDERAATMSTLIL